MHNIYMLCYVKTIWSLVLTMLFPFTFTFLWTTLCQAMSCSLPAFADFISSGHSWNSCKLVTQSELSCSCSGRVNVQQRPSIFYLSWAYEVRFFVDISHVFIFLSNTYSRVLSSMHTTVNRRTVHHLNCLE